MKSPMVQLFQRNKEEFLQWWGNRSIFENSLCNLGSLRIIHGPNHRSRGIRLLGCNLINWILEGMIVTHLLPSPDE